MRWMTDNLLTIQHCALDSTTYEYDIHMNYNVLVGLVYNNNAFSRIMIEIMKGL